MITGKDPLERFRGVFTASVAIHLEDPSKAVKTLGVFPEVFPGVFPCEIIDDP